MCGFILFWIAVGMMIALFFTENICLCIFVIIVLMILGYNLFCH
ncbi:MAG: hypothetical protein ACLU70_03905 [Lachnospira sp.]